LLCAGGLDTLSVEVAEENEGADDIEDASEGRLPNVLEADEIRS
jgi:hypothetical protein